MRPPLSAVIITHNESARIADCLDSVSFCDEILVVDSGSTDGTQRICLARNARLIEQPWLGYGAQKRFAVAQAKHDWVLCIDADEIITSELRSSIEQAIARNGTRAYALPRRNRFMGRWLAHGEGYPDLCLRLFDRQVANWSDDPVHEKVETNEFVRHLKGDLLHNSAISLEHYLDKQNRYTTLQANAMIASGKRVGMLSVVASPIIRFIKFYLLHQGFRDGLPGLVHISIGCFNSFCKYAKVAASSHKEPRKIAQSPALAD